MQAWSTIKLYLLCQVEERSFTKWGSEDGLEEEIERRKRVKLGKKEAAKAKELNKLRRATLTVKHLTEPAPHTHVFGEGVQSTEDPELWHKTCVGCGFTVEFEKM